jgi:hypothetical protein
VKWAVWRCQQVNRIDHRKVSIAAVRTPIARDFYGRQRTQTPARHRVIAHIKRLTGTPKLFTRPLIDSHSTLISAIWSRPPTHQTLRFEGVTCVLFVKIFRCRTILGLPLRARIEHLEDLPAELIRGRVHVCDADPTARVSKRVSSPSYCITSIDRRSRRARGCADLLTQPTCPH